MWSHFLEGMMGQHGPLDFVATWLISLTTPFAFLVLIVAWIIVIKNLRKIFSSL